MTVHKLDKRMTAQERMAWLRLMGTQPMPSDREEMTRQASVAWERRSAQCASDVQALCVLVEAAETLNVFHGRLDTAKSSLFGPKPKSLPKEFSTVDALKLAPPRMKTAESANDG